MLKIKPKKAYALVSKINPKISALNIYPHNDLIIHSEEMLIEVEIRLLEAKNKKK